MRRRLLVTSSVLVMGATVVLGCSSASDDEGGEGIQPIEAEEGEAESDAAGEPEVEPEPAPDPEPEAETEREDPFAFDDPSEIDLEYVDRVMAELLAVVGDVLKDVLERDLGDDLESSDLDRVGAVFSGPRLAQMGQSVQDYARDSSLRAGFVPLSRFGEPVWSTVRVIHADEACIVAVGTYDLTDVSIQPFPVEELTAVVLSVMDSDQRLVSQRHNLTGWRVHEQAQLVRGDDREPVTPEELADLDYEAGLSLPCDAFAVRP